MSEDLNALLNAFLDGRLSAEEQARLRAKLERPATVRALTRLRALRREVRAAAPRPTPEQSRSMWSAIAARVAAQEASPATAAVPPRAAVEAPASTAASGWDGILAVFSRRWAPAWGLGLAGAAAAWALVLLLPHRLAPPRPEAEVPVQVRPAAERPLSVLPRTRHSFRVRPQAGREASRRRPVAAPVAGAGPGHPPETAAPALAGLSKALAQESQGGTEVEQALADSQVDRMISRFLVVPPAGSAPVVAMMQPSPAATASVGLGSGEDAVSYQEPAAPALGVMDSAAPGPARGGKDGNGFWNWKPAAKALNEGQWAQARVELQEASLHSGEASERVFARSALDLLAAPGGPLEGFQSALPRAGSLQVLSAGTWQLLVDSRLARFSRGVSVGLPGYRAEGDSFLLDLTFDRAEFAPGTHFIKVSGETPARVVDASKQPVSADDFYAPSGADYDIADRVLRLR